MLVYRSDHVETIMNLNEWIQCKISLEWKKIGLGPLLDNRSVTAVLSLQYNQIPLATSCVTHQLDLLKDFQEDRMYIQVKKHD